MSVLDDIVAGVRADLAERQQAVSLDDVVRRATDAAPARDPRPVFRAPGVSVIAEVKRASPSKGALADIADPADLADAYARGGASAISVLTERRRFNGSLADLDAVRARVDVPVLRKDFMVDDYQFYEARAHGADLVLLIVAALDDADLVRFQALAGELGMTCLVETHTADEVRRALDAGAELIGVNNRNLKTLEVDLAQFGRLSDLIGDQAIRVAESGINTRDDVELVARQGADVVLVGEALVRAGDPEQAVRTLAVA